VCVCVSQLCRGAAAAGNAGRYTSTHMPKREGREREREEGRTEKERDVSQSGKWRGEK